MRTTWTLALVTAASLTVGCTDAGHTTAPVGSSTITDASTSTSAARTTTTIAATTTTELATTTTIPIAPWTLYPSAPVAPLRPNTIRSYSKINTTDPVVFLTIDDGFIRDPRVPELLAQHQAPATLFLIAGSLAKDPEYFRKFLDLGGSINTHTLQHAHLPGMTPEDQTFQICGMVSTIEATYGSVGYFFRPPRGESDDNSLAAARSCGVRAMILWRVSVSDNQINTWGTRPIMPGDIILLHFLSNTYDSLVMLFAELNRLGLKVARLEDYLPAG